MSFQQKNVVGVVLAGGLARRMGGGDKCLLQINGVSLLSRCLERLTPQVDRLIISANGDPDRFLSYKLPVVADGPVVTDGIGEFAGPLAGILAGMRWVGEHSPDKEYIATIASDTPFFPRDFIVRMGQAIGEEKQAIALANSGGQLHPVFGLWPIALADDLEKALRSGERKIRSWAGRHKMIEVPFDIQHKGLEAIDPFFNVNSPEDLLRAQFKTHD